MSRVAFAGALLVACFSFAGCMTDDEDLGQLELPLSWCTTSLDCNDGSYCTTETGDCLSPPNCNPNRPCVLVCFGRCEKKEPCGDGFCPAGQVCCNDSCGICTEPGGYCTEQFCEPIPLL